MKLPALTTVLAGAFVLASAMSGASGAQPRSPSNLKLIADSHYGVADALQLDAATFDRLIVLLAEQLRERSDYVQAFDAGTRVPRHAEPLRAEAEIATREISALRELLGQEKLERYQELRVSLGERYQVRQLDERLPAPDKLNSTQRERLVELLNEHVRIEREMTNLHRFPFGWPLREFSSSEELQRHSQLQRVASDEQVWREMPESNRRLRERAAEFLTEPQLATLAKMHAEQAERLQLHIEQMREQLGLSTTIPERAAVTQVLPASVQRDVKLSLKAAVNSESPRYLTIVVSSGKSVNLKIAEGLFLEATPIVFEGDAYDLRVQYFETGVTGKRLIGHGGLSGTLVQATDGRSRPVGGGNGSVITGSKGYAVELSALVEAT